MLLFLWFFLEESFFKCKMKLLSTRNFYQLAFILHGKTAVSAPTSLFSSAKAMRLSFLLTQRMPLFVVV